MKKTITLIMMSVLFSISMAFAQDMSLIVNGEEVADGATIYYGEVELLSSKCDPHISVRNNTSGALEATVTAILLEAEKNCLPSYCGFGSELCVPVMLGMPVPRIATVEAGATLATGIYASPVMNPEDFYARMEVALSCGDTNISVYIVLAPTSNVSTPVTKDTYISQYGNLVSLNFNFATDAERVLNVYDITGRKIKQLLLPNNIGVVQLPGSPKGIYLYSISENGSVVKSGKYIVK